MDYSNVDFIHKFQLYLQTCLFWVDFIHEILTLVSKCQFKTWNENLFLLVTLILFPTSYDDSLREYFVKAVWAGECRYQHYGGSAGEQDARGEEDVERVWWHRGEDKRADDSHLGEKTDRKVSHLFALPMKKELQAPHADELHIFNSESPPPPPASVRNCDLLELDFQLFFKKTIKVISKGAEVRHMVLFQSLVPISRSHSLKTPSNQCSQTRDWKKKKMPVYSETGSIFTVANELSVSNATLIRTRWNVLMRCLSNQNSRNMYQRIPRKKK